MKIIKQATILYLFICIVAFSNSLKAISEEKYEASIMMTFHNGSGIWDLSYKNDVWPTTLAFDEKGNMYIYDLLNWRISFFDDEYSFKGSVDIPAGFRSFFEKDFPSGSYEGETSGGWIGINNKGNIMVSPISGLGGGPGKGVIELNKSCELIKFYASPEAFRDKEYFKIIENKDKVGNITEMLKMTSQCQIDIGGYTDDQPRYFLSYYTRPVKVAYVMIVKNTGRYDDYISEYVRDKKFHYGIVIADGKSVIERFLVVSDSNHSNNAFYTTPIGEDKYGNSYILVDARFDSKTTKNVYKYNLRGDLIATMEMIDNAHMPVVDQNGRVFQLVKKDSRDSVEIELIEWKKK